jgi:hypothetical protein
MKRTVLLVFALAAMTFAANAQTAEKIDVDAKAQIAAALDSYFAVKNALVDSNVETTSAAADKLVENLAAVDDTKLTAAQNAVWTKRAVALKKDASHINKNKEIGHQREHFETLSINMYAVIKAIAANSADVFLHYCPMRKASWMSESKEVRNPYYGKKMLDCGDVKATLKPQTAN